MKPKAAGDPHVRTRTFAREKAGARSCGYVDRSVSRSRFAGEIRKMPPRSEHAAWPIS